MRPDFDEDDIDDLYSRVWDGSHGDDDIELETPIERPQWDAWPLFMFCLCLASLFVLLHLIGVWAGWWA